MELNSRLFDGRKWFPQIGSKSVKMADMNKRRDEKSGSDFILTVEHTDIVIEGTWHIRQESGGLQKGINRTNQY